MLQRFPRRRSSVVTGSDMVKGDVTSCPKRRAAFPRTEGLSGAGPLTARYRDSQGRVFWTADQLREILKVPVLLQMNENVRESPLRFMSWKLFTTVVSEAAPPSATAGIRRRAAARARAHRDAPFITQPPSPCIESLFV
jgi:hypothetical protein